MNRLPVGNDSKHQRTGVDSETPIRGPEWSGAPIRKESRKPVVVSTTKTGPGGLTSFMTTKRAGDDGIVGSVRRFIFRGPTAPSGVGDGVVGNDSALLLPSPTKTTTAYPDIGSKFSTVAGTMTTDERERARWENKKHSDAFWEDSENFRTFKKQMGQGQHVTGVAAQQLWSSKVEKAVRESSPASTPESSASTL